MFRQLAVSLASCLLACGPPLSAIDPELAARRAQLGPEDPKVPQGPLHRPGQPCVVCHGPGDDADTFSVAGTVFRDNVSTVPAADVEVVFIDSRSSTFIARTNCVGNFFVKPSQYLPVAPLWVSLRLGAEVIDMESPIHRDWSCAGCHSDKVGPASAGPVFLVADELAAERVPSRACRPDEGETP